MENRHFLYVGNVFVEFLLNIIYLYIICTHDSNIKVFRFPRFPFTFSDK